LQTGVHVAVERVVVEADDAVFQAWQLAYAVALCLLSRILRPIASNVIIILLTLITISLPFDGCVILPCFVRSVHIIADDSRSTTVHHHEIIEKVLFY